MALFLECFSSVLCACVYLCVLYVCMYICLYVCMYSCMYVRMSVSICGTKFVVRYNKIVYGVI